MRVKKVRILPVVVLSVLFVFVQGMLFQAYSAQEAIYPGWSLRYEEPKDWTAIETARAYLQDNAGDYPGLKLHYWTEADRLVYGDLDIAPEGASAICISYVGAPELVYPMTLRTGRMPGEFETGHCAVSTALSWKLWQGLDTVGRSVKIGDRLFTVCGVFEDTEAKLLYPGDDSMSWPQVEVTGTGMSRENLTQFLQGAGLGEADAVIDGAALSHLWQIALWLPAFVLWICGLWLFLNTLRSRQLPWLKPVLAVVLLFAFVLALPSLLGKLPSWLIPSKWSDFAFWANLSENLRGHVVSFFRVATRQKDLQWKWLALKTVLLLTGQWVVVSLISSRLSALLIPGGTEEASQRSGEPKAQLPAEKE